jgi:hypothetical protein
MSMSMLMKVSQLFTIDAVVGGKNALQGRWSATINNQEISLDRVLCAN